MRECTLFEDGAFPSSDTLKDGNSALQKLVSLYVDQIGRWLSVFGNEYRLAGLTKVG